MRYAATSADPELIIRLCGAPMGMFAWGRPELLDHVETLDTMIANPSAGGAGGAGGEGGEGAGGDRAVSAADAQAGRAGIAYARWGRAWLQLDLPRWCDACDQFDELAPDDLTGVAATMRSATLLAGGDLAAATALRAATVDDRRVAQGGRDLSLAFSVYGACSGDLRGLLSDAWVERVGELAHTSGRRCDPTPRAGGARMGPRR